MDRKTVTKKTKDRRKHVYAVLCAFKNNFYK